LGNIPLPALAINPPVQQEDPVTRLMRMRAGFQQIQSGQLELQQKQQALKDQHAQTQAFLNWDGKDPSDLVKGVLKSGGSASAATAVQQHFLQLKDTASQIAQRDSQTGETNLKTIIEKHNQFLGAINAAEQVPDEQLHDHLANTVNQLIPDNADPQALQFKQQTMQILQSGISPADLRQQMDVQKKSLQGSKEQFAQAQTQADTAKAANDAALSQSKLDLQKAWKSDPDSVFAQVDKIVPPTGPNAALNARTKNSVMFALRQGDVDAAKETLKAAAEQMGAVEKDVAVATNPAIQAAKLHLATATKAAEQAIADGDPKAAAALLVDGTVAPSQLISSRKPAFAQQAFTQAARMQSGWNAQKAEADFKVASSPNNVQFFGSAKSLTDKGGTLDQLADAAKDIPGNRIPVFNSVADVMKASTGSGPIAKYASILLGVADDYSKVMGGGQGSDTSRTQALKLVPADASPAARAAAIEGIRGAVLSQQNSRIGNNSVLQKMYGGGASSAGAGQQGTPGPAPQTHSFSVSAWQKANPRGDANAAKAAAQAQGYQVIP
jgi:hypothetical protein